ncbi:FAD-linked oxidase C-terminal domain-containing protein [Paracoccus sp. 1_MG-2023]|uniref:FAD-binding oxidoreductase n=1 Tax=unclassified Paracoccus (in: a-proteobacteria) TaxID=2688777 RepID=UPI001C096401|nr:MULTISPECIES: FAD-linked oxidase C-terminal domain-containing protein [unclassified Paracoccus (in: a-proteobacteria)]MBU2957837.1 FAD-binding protein [Paracoccus sp. C2R09]MDO6667315.1 FAD-linked oxidase C-terminal domain-containing protein [Paracoccus sp. 1_MG-2023]
MTTGTADHQDALDELRAALGDRFSTGDSIRDLHGRDQAYAVPHLPDAVVFPRSTEEVSEIMRICSRHRCPVVPFGIGSSLEGHVVPLQGGVSIDLSQMNAIIAINERDLDAVVQPGVTRTQLNAELRATGLMFTVDPGADATLGGMAATRASGTNAVRYGTMRENVMALTVVLPDGRVVRTGSRARKSSAGYDLTRLFVGSEGTLGVITELTVRLFGTPERIMAATCAFDSVEAAVDTVILAIQSGLPMARIELLDEMQMRGMNIYNPDLELPEKPHLFLEFHGTEAGVAEQVESFEAIAGEFGASRFRTATRTEDRTRLWEARHNAYYAAKALAPGCAAVLTDCCVPISALAECIARTKELIAASGLTAPLVGHVGDGNFHLSILIDQDDPDQLSRAKALAGQVNMVSLELGGTVTGEHGVGSGKIAYMRAEHGEGFDLMAQIKRSIDPLNIMNPGKIVEI